MKRFLCRAVIVFILVGSVLYFFGYPSLLKFKKRQTFISKSSVKFDEENPPAITVLGWRQREQKGWKNATMHDNLENHCNLTLKYQEVKACVDENTFSHDETILDAENIDGAKIAKEKFWTEDLTNYDAGKLHTLNNSYRIGQDSTRLKIGLNKSLNYTIFIHDPHIFMYSFNPDSIPQIQLNLVNGYY